MKSKTTTPKVTKKQRADREFMRKVDERLKQDAHAAYVEMVKHVREWIRLAHPWKSLIEVSCWDRGSGETLASFSTSDDLTYAKGDLKAAGYVVAKAVSS